MLPVCRGISLLPVIIAFIAYDSSPPFLPGDSVTSLCQAFYLGSWISLICVLLPAALAAPDSRQLDMLKVLRVFEGSERVGRIGVRTKNWLLLLLF